MNRPSERASQPGPPGKIGAVPLKRNNSHFIQLCLNCWKLVGPPIIEIILSNRTAIKLKHDYSGYWSRRIDSEHRLLYRVADQDRLIAQLRLHYGGMV